MDSTQVAWRVELSELKDASGARISRTEDIRCVDARFTAVEAQIAALGATPQGRESACVDAPVPGG
eukprot:12017439-Alexandrium_andersonii.AAC.1